MWIFYALIAPFFYAGTNVIDSILVKRYIRHPILILWSYGLILVIPVLIFPFFVDIRSEWWLVISLGALAGYLGDLMYYRTLKVIDVSLINAGWAILTLMMSVGGFIFFDESWSFLQAMGAALVLLSVFLLCCWHHPSSAIRTLSIFTVMGLFYVFPQLISKAALVGGDTDVAVLYWFFLSRVMLYLCIPFTQHASLRREAFALLHVRNTEFFVICFFGAAAWFLGATGIILAYSTGYISLVAIVGEIQPFYCIGISILISWFLPAFAPRELLTAQSIRTKLMSFFIVFIGLVLVMVG